LHSPRAHRFGDVQRPRADIFETEIDFSADLPLSIIGNADAAGFRNSFRARRY
jgi:hypothetical protein